MPEERQEKEEGEREKYRKDHWLQEAKKRQKVGFWNSVIRTYATKWAEKYCCFQTASKDGRLLDFFVEIIFFKKSILHILLFLSVQNGRSQVALSFMI